MKHERSVAWLPLGVSGLAPAAFAQDTGPETDAAGGGGRARSGGALRSDARDPGVLRARRAAVTGASRHARIRRKRAARGASHALCGALLLASAVSSTGCIALLAEKPIRVGPESLFGTRWLLQTVDGSSVPVDTESTLAFEYPSTLSGSGGCSAFTGGVDISGDALLPGPLKVEERACRPELMEVQSRYLGALATVQRYQAGDAYLLLFDEDGRQRLGLSRIASPSR